MMNDASPFIRIAGLLFFAAIVTHPTHVAAADSPLPVVKVVEGGESRLTPEEVLTTVVGPGVNQPEPYPGYTLRDGTLVSLHGSYTRGGLRVIFSTDGGQTWIAPAKDRGFLVDNCHAYGKAFELPDGTLLIADQETGGHTTADAKSMSLRLLHVRIRPDHSGIDLLPASSR